MAKRLQLRRGTTAQTNAFKGAVGEVTVDTDKDVLVVHDGVTAGGFPVAARANANGTISLIKKDGTIIDSINAAGLFNNTLTSTDTDQALTAAQGKLLYDAVKRSIGGGVAGYTYANYASSRNLNTVYTKPETTLVTINATLNQVGAYLSVNSGGFIGMSGSTNGTTDRVTVTFVVPAGTSYSVTSSSSSTTINLWMEYNGKY